MKPTRTAPQQGKIGGGFIYLGCHVALMENLARPATEVICGDTVAFVVSYRQTFSTIFVSRNVGGIYYVKEVVAPKGVTDDLPEAMPFPHDPADNGVAASLCLERRKPPGRLRDI